MKTLKNIGLKALLLALSFFASGCVAFVAFEKPQPFFKKNESRFDKRFQGMYFDSSDSRTLEITETAMLITSNETRAVPVNEIHSVSNAGIIEANLSQSSNVSIPNRTESIANVQERADTVFLISDCNILRQFKGKYYLNYKELDKYWYLELMALEKGDKLIISTVYVEDIETLEEEVPLVKIRDEKGVLVRVVLQPNKRQLKKLMRNKDYQMDLFVGHKMSAD
ncbi:MAG: hypothetical protein ABJF04_16835 [Reichenbachiella sp.]|uniref:hypothetical protein n=1 Tax=Reichenbachiella sp. TaxID=2184521 RepID=UPI00326330DC